MKSVCILNYGSGNVKSVYNLFASLSDKVNISNDTSNISQATHIVLPGVGAFGAAMEKITNKLPMALLERSILIDRKPFLGICVGMQVLADMGFEFGEHRGLGWIHGKIERLKAVGLPLPHIGWNNITCKRNSPLLLGLETGPDFYFVHGYALKPDDPEEIVATTIYGEEFCSIVQHDNICGVQFHPEKSQKAGIKLIENFLKMI